jgi:hypothetical protein
MRRSFSRLLALLGLSSACAVYGSSLLTSGVDGGGGTDAGSDTGVKPMCPLARWPARPAADDPSNNDLDFVVAISDLHFQQADGGIGGYDLDGICTCIGNPPGPESCTPQMGATPHCDGPGGIDNSGGDLLAKFQQIGNVFSDSDLTAALAKGSGGVLLRLQRYNGKANDTQVTFSIYTSNGTIPDDAGNMIPPAFDGGDSWTVDSDSLVGGVAPPYVPNYSDPSAYVSDGTLVANVDFPLSFGTRSVSRLLVKLKGGVVTARIVPWKSSFQLTDGILAGRFTTQNFLTNLQGFKDPFNSNVHLCGDSGTYLVVKSQVCHAADVTSDLLSDGKGAPCDGISAAFFFKASPAVFGPADKAAPANPPCGIGYKDDCL